MVSVGWNMLIETRVAHRHIQHSDDGKIIWKLLDLKKKTIFHVLYIFLEKSSGERGDQTVGDSPPIPVAHRQHFRRS